MFVFLRDTNPERDSGCLPFKCQVFSCRNPMFFSFRIFLVSGIVTGIGEADRKARHGVGRNASHHQDDVTFLGLRGSRFRMPRGNGEWACRDVEETYYDQ